MADNKITKFPVKFSQRIKNIRGNKSVSCLVTDRWLLFPETSEWVDNGHYMFVDVMTGGYGREGKARKLCMLCISKEDLLAAMEEVDKARSD